MNKLVPRLMLVAVFTASAALAEAQAVARGSGSSSSGSSGSSSSGGGGATTSSSSGGGGSTYSAPEHAAPPRTPSHTSGGGGSSSQGSSSSSSSGSGGSHSGAGVSRHPSGSSTTSATAPTYARPSESRGITGYAVPRVRGAYRPPTYIYTPYYIYNPWAFGAFGLGYGLGYFYDPSYGYGYGGYPYGGYGYGGGYGGYPYYGGGGYYGGNEAYESQSYSQPDELKGSLRIKVKPREARVIVDGAFVGTVDDFDGVFQKLSLPEGRHQISLQLDGYEPVSFDVMIVAGETVNYKGELHKR
jgi:hypothetical protein